MEYLKSKKRSNVIIAGVAALGPFFTDAVTTPAHAQQDTLPQEMLVQKAEDTSNKTLAQLSKAQQEKLTQTGSVELGETPINLKTLSVTQKMHIQKVLQESLDLYLSAPTIPQEHVALLQKQLKQLKDDEDLLFSFRVSVVTIEVQGKRFYPIQAITGDMAPVPVVIALPTIPEGLRAVTK